METFIIFLCIVLPIAGIIAFICNSLVITFYWRTRDKMISFVYIGLCMCQGFVGLLSLLQCSTFLIYNDFMYPVDKPGRDYVEDAYMVTHVFIFMIFHRITAFINCALSVMRSINLLTPFYKLNKRIYVASAVLYTIFLVSLNLFIGILQIVKPIEMRPPSPPQEQGLDKDPGLPPGPGGNGPPGPGGDGPPAQDPGPGGIEEEDGDPGPPETYMTCPILNQCVVFSKFPSLKVLYDIVVLLVPAIITTIAICLTLAVIWKRKKHFTNTPQIVLKDDDTEKKRKTETDMTITILMILAVYLFCNLVHIIFIFAQRAIGIKNAIMSGYFFQTSYFFENGVVIFEVAIVPVIMILRSKRIKDFSSTFLMATASKISNSEFFSRHQ